MATDELTAGVEMGPDRAAAEATADARQIARIATARARLLEATAVRDRRVEELRQVLHGATASRT